MLADGNVNIQAAKAWSSQSVSEIYEKTRPNYNIDSVEFLLEKVGALKDHSESQPFTIVELGAGTGKFTRAALKVFEKRSVKNVTITSTEPIKEMCEKFKEMVPNIQILQRPAHNLGKLCNYFTGGNASLATIHSGLMHSDCLALTRTLLENVIRYCNLLQVTHECQPLFILLRSPDGTVGV